VAYSLLHAGTVLSVGGINSIAPSCTSTTAGSMLVCPVWAQGSVTFSLPAGWRAAAPPTGSGCRAQVWYYPNCPAGITSVTVNTSASTTIVGQVLEFTDPSGSNLVPLDAQGTQFATSPATPQAVATSTAAIAGDLVVCASGLVFASATSSTLTPGAGFTSAGNYGNGATQNGHASFDYLLNSGAGAQTDSVAFTGASPSSFAGCIAAFRIASAGPGPVLFDSVGPSASGYTGVSTTTSPATWSHTLTSGDTGLLVAFGIDNTPDSGFTITGVTAGGVAMTQVGGKVESGTGGGGFITVWQLLNPPTGTITISVSWTGIAFTNGGHPNGGSIAFTGAGAFSAPVTANGSSTIPSVAVPTASTSGMAAAFAVCGSAFISATAPLTSRYLGGAGGQGAGWMAGGTAPGTGSSVTAAWSSNSDWWAVIGVEVQPAAAGGPVSRPQRVRRNVQGNPGAIPSQHITTELTGAIYGR
jgi:hypothetical protein